VIVAALEVRSVDPMAIRMKKRIFKLLREAVSRLGHTCLRGFEAGVLPAVLDAMPGAFGLLEVEPTGQIDNALAEFLSLVCAVIVKSSEWASSFITSEFVHSVLLPCARLRSGDLEDFHDAPAQFIGAALPGPDPTTPLAIRAACASLANRARL
jgi:hypothetical protein